MSSKRSRPSKRALGAAFGAAIVKLGRHVAAVKGWRTRRAEKLRGQGLSPQAIETWSSLNARSAKNLSGYRQYVLGPAYGLHGKRLEDRLVLKAMQEAGDERFQKFAEAAQLEGLNPRQTRTAWFSPKATRR